VFDTFATPAFDRRPVRLGRLSHLAGLALAALIVASCSTATGPSRAPNGTRASAAGSVDASPTGEPSPTDEPTASPTATPSPSPTPGVTFDQISGMCAKAAPIPAATKYGGKLHPLMLVNEITDGWMVDASGIRYAIDQKWLAGEWANDLQLILCVGSEGSQNMGACSGSYKREGDGVVGKVVRYRFYQKIRVMVASTGKTLQSKTLYGSTPKCSGSVSIPATAPAPWHIYGSEITDSSVNKYAVSVSTQK
jgi:hypothetical protein